MFLNLANQSQRSDLTIPFLVYKVADVFESRREPVIGKFRSRQVFTG